MHKLQMGGVPLPVLYVCEDNSEACVAQSAGIPYIIRPKGFTDKKLVAFCLYQTLRDKFPRLDWEAILGIRWWRRNEIIVHVPGAEDCDGARTSGDDPGEEVDIVTDIATDEREFNGGLDEPDVGERPLEQYIGSAAASVSIEELQDLGYLPTFLDDIAEAIKKNIYGRMWSEGYNKKRGFPLGNFDSTSEKPNLIILDVSGSIPKGVSTTMLTLIETLRDRANADLIVTGSYSLYWKAGEKLPSPQWIRNHIGYNNEAKQFYEIMRSHILGRSWGNVICFGDDDCPTRFHRKWSGSVKDLDGIDLTGTTVEHLMSFHTWNECTPGYARWCHAPGVLTGDEVFNTKWCKFME